MDDFKFVPGVVPSTRDPKDYLYAQVVTVDINTLPSSFFYDRIPIDTQIIGDCVGESSRGIKLIQCRRDIPNFTGDVSPDFTYAECKKLDGQPQQEGTQPKFAMQVLNKIGICHRELFPTINNATQLPTASQAAYDDAKHYTISAYARIQTIDEIKHALVTQGPVLGAVIVTDNFIHCEAGGFIDLPGGSILGGHAICFDGFDDSMTHTYANGVTRKGFVRFVNSWGEAWGDKGYGYLPYDYLTFASDLGMHFFIEAWSSVDTVPTPQPAPTPAPQPQPTPQPTPVPTPPAPIKLYHVQVGAFRDEENAKVELAKLAAAGFEGYIKYE